MSSMGGSSMEDLVTDSNEAIEFKLVREADDIKNDQLAFHPSMSHQIFGPQENIFGYKNLKILMYFSAAQLNPYLQIKYTEKIDPKKHNTAEADDIHAILVDKLQIKFNENLNDFIRSLDKEMKFKPFGELRDSFAVDVVDTDSDKIQNNADNVDGCIKQKIFEVYYCDVTTPGLLMYHERLQTFIMWFIDGASYIDTDDEKWKFFLVFEKYKKDGDYMYAIAGYSTVYEYYAYPNNIRPRLSQVLILPPFQRQGLGAHLLSSIYNHYKLMNTVKDITVEVPSEDFQVLRDYVDCKNCMDLSSFQPSELSKGFSKAMVEEAANKHKINKIQARRIYEILKLKTVNKNNSKQYKDYRIEVKQRLNLPNQNEQRKLKKIEKFMKPQEIAELKALSVLNDEQRLSNLDKSYKELEELYERVLGRLSLS